MTPDATFCLLFIGASGWVTAYVALRAEDRQFRERCRADRIAKSYTDTREAILRDRERAELAAESARALADDRGEAIEQLEADRAEMAEALSDTAHELAELKAHPGRAMRALQLAQTKPAAVEGRLALDPVWRQAHPDQVAA